MDGGHNERLRKVHQSTAICLAVQQRARHFCPHPDHSNLWFRVDIACATYMTASCDMSHRMYSASSTSEYDWFFITIIAWLAVGMVVLLHSLYMHCRS